MTAIDNLNRLQNAFPRPIISLEAISQEARANVLYLHENTENQDDVQDMIDTLEDLASHAFANTMTEALYQVALSFKIIERLEGSMDIDFATELEFRKLKRYQRSIRSYMEKNGAEPDSVYANSLMPL